MKINLISDANPSLFSVRRAVAAATHTLLGTKFSFLHATLMEIGLC